MFANYFKTAIRNIINHKGYSIINIAGLAIGLGFLNLIQIPIGTALGIYTIWVLLKSETVDFFTPTLTTQTGP